MTYFKKILHALKYLECNSTPFPLLVCMVLWICKWAPPPLTHSAQRLSITRWSYWLQGSSRQF